MNEVAATFRRAGLGVVGCRRGAAPNQLSGDMAPHTRAGKRIDCPSTAGRELKQPIFECFGGLSVGAHAVGSCVVIAARSLFNLHFALFTFQFARIQFALSRIGPSTLVDCNHQEER